MIKCYGVVHGGQGSALSKIDGELVNVSVLLPQTKLSKSPFALPYAIT